jgi:hypothetical protein
VCGGEEQPDYGQFGWVPTPRATVRRRDVRSGDAAADVWDWDDRAAGWRLDGPRDWSILV